MSNVHHFATSIIPWKVSLPAILLLVIALVAPQAQAQSQTFNVAFPFTMQTGFTSCYSVGGRTTGPEGRFSYGGGQFISYGNQTIFEQSSFSYKRVTRSTSLLS